MFVTERLEALGLTLPSVPSPVEVDLVVAVR
jgi:hypothetical protein